MKRLYLGLIGLSLMLTASAQFSVGINGNYTMYKGDFQKSTPGAQIRLVYDATEKVSALFSFNYGFPIKLASSTIVQSQNNNSIDVPSEIKFNFKTFNLMAHYNFVGGDEESTGKFYGIVGAGLVIVSYNESITGSYDKNTYTQTNLVSDKQSGFTLNFGLGGEYKLGGPALFGEAGLALPANQVNYQYVSNPIPAHFFINLGVKLPLTSANN